MYNLFMTEVPVVQKPAQFSKSMDSFIYDRDLCHEGVESQ